MAMQGVLRQPGAERTPHQNRVAARVRASVTVLCLVAISDSCAPGLDHRRAAPSATSVTTLVMADPVDHLDVLAREPMVVEHPDGTLFVSGFGEPGPKLWQSRDRGATWARVNVGSEADGAIGNSDVDLAVARDGTLYFVTMGFDRKVNEGTHITIGVSKNAGATWSWTMLSKTRFDDRPWVEVAADGTAHVIWNDGSGVCHAVSLDGGVTWTERPRIHAQGGSSHLAVGPNREVAVRVTPASASGNLFTEGVDLVAVSVDGGTTWRKHAAPGQREWSPPSDTEGVPRWVEPLAWDARGALYSLWTDRNGLWLARSIDQGGTWTTWRVAQSEDVLYFPYLVARGLGELAATWFSGRGETLQAHVGRIEVSDGDAPPRMITSPPFRPDSWRSGARPEDPPTRDTASEYLAVTFLSEGGLAVVSPIQNGRAQRFGFSWWRIEAR